MPFPFLGFDPWNECSKGLADLLQEEEQTTKPQSTQHISTASHTHSFLSPFPRDVRNLYKFCLIAKAMFPVFSLHCLQSKIRPHGYGFPYSLLEQMRLHCCLIIFLL